MKQHEREYFISRIRSGIYNIRHNGQILRVLSPTIEDEYELNQAYMDAYDEAAEDGIMTLEDSVKILRKRGLWTDQDDLREESIPKDLERLKIEAFKSRNDEIKLTQVRRYLRGGEEQYKALMARKHSLQENTREGVAAVHKSLEFIKRCTFLKGELYEFEDDAPIVLNAYFGMLLPETTVRLLARTEPWRSLWVMNEDGLFELFAKNGRELTVDQRNMLVWSKMYANVQESPECPADDVIADDDMIDGWFAIQREKRDKERAKGEMEASTSNEKIKNSGEIFVMAKTKKDADRVDSMNDTNAKMIKQQRINIARRRGQVETGEFADEKMQMQQMSNEQFKGKFGS